MALKIRMTRAGAKKRPFYKIVVADSRYPRDGRFIARIGSYNPMLPKDSKERVKWNDETMGEVKSWLAKGAQPSDRVLRFLDAAGLMKRKPRNNPEKAIPKAERRAKEAEAAAPAAPAAGAAPAAPAAAAPAPAAEAPAAEAKA